MNQGILTNNETDWGADSHEEIAKNIMMLLCFAEREEREAQRAQCGGWDGTIVMDGFQPDEMLEAEKTKDVQSRGR